VQIRWHAINMISLPLQRLYNVITNHENDQLKVPLLAQRTPDHEMSCTHCAAAASARKRGKSIPCVYVIERVQMRRGGVAANVWCVGFECSSIPASVFPMIFGEPFPFLS